ncbi:MAG: GNAT family N-acetyltransferase [Candidatus Heimdallarchaeota archaeon]|nr:GNAT family N-acetyltransferase [Candidatus Heimdallarchaeota archaeon]
MTSVYDLPSPFFGEKVFLRAIEESDLPSIMEHWNAYETRVSLGKFVPSSSIEREQWINEVNQKAKKGEAYTFAIIHKVKEEFLGTVALKRINMINRGASLSVSIHNPANHNKGYGTDAVRCILKIGFNILNLHRIELHVYEFTANAVHIYEKLGFKKVGVRRQASFIIGEYRDDLVMDILEEEFVEL